ncbi:6-phosphogluconate dehydrogenase C-terminal domain-like protein [Mycena pura]|uniref:6-phosphogluconate dehydrogenase C-terminal domain-like protein n=1 Tax=Mycena pura TaxID=153505 RepID=A0AAD6VDK4_9AGAR|nr:6-phosphogluconate dehydrogenase C-terminal domain-like protein [Mycena pura]
MVTIAIIAAGAMGSGVAKVLTRNGVKVLTNLDNRSEATRRRAQEAGMQDASFEDISSTCDWVLSILPPSNAFSFAEKFLQHSTRSTRSPAPVFVECNAVNPATVHKIAALFRGSIFSFVDAGIIGGPPLDDYNPTFYASADEEALLDRIVGLSEHGLKISALKGEARIGAASALKMSYAGITKGTTGLFTTMILAAHQSSPATAEALMHELHASQPALLKRMSGVIPPMIPKAYRWVGEMSEIAGFVGDGEGDIYRGLSELYARIERSEKGDRQDSEVLAKFAKEAKEILEKK